MKMSSCGNCISAAAAVDVSPRKRRKISLIIQIALHGTTSLSDPKRSRVNSFKFQLVNNWIKSYFSRELKLEINSLSINRIKRKLSMPCAGHSICAWNDSLLLPLPFQLNLEFLSLRQWTWMSSTQCTLLFASNFSIAKDSAAQQTSREFFCECRRKMRNWKLLRFPSKAIKAKREARNWILFLEQWHFNLLAESSTLFRNVV